MKSSIAFVAAAQAIFLVVLIALVIRDIRNLRP